MSCGQDQAARRHNRTMSAVFTVAPARSPEAIEAVRGLFREYGATPHVQACVTGFADEIAGLPGPYAEPRGALLLARSNNRPAGCVALRPVDESAAEMKRLYVSPEYRGRRISEGLAAAIIDVARTRGYTRLRLSTLPSMIEARAVYLRLGFREVAPDAQDPIPGASYLELAL